REQLRGQGETGAQHEQTISKSELTLSGWRSTGPDRLEILYSLQTTGGPWTPWPSNALAQKGADGHWYALRQYACGIEGLANGGCYTTTGPAPIENGETPVTALPVPASP